jgi:hypothetical protein
MLCSNPYIKDTIPHGCGQCLGCRVNKRRAWTNRILLESMCHESSAFVTLTYDEGHLPKDYSLDPKHVTKWQKNLRYHSGLDLRFFSVGEYGEKTKRPHYHAAVFGLPGCASQNLKCPCSACETLRASWKKGHVFNGTLTKDSASYIAGYVTKKMTDKDPQQKYENLIKKGKPALAEEYKKRVIDFLEGKHPEFARMSNRPGIGAGPNNVMIDTLMDLLETDYGCDLIAELQDAPDIIKIGGQEILLGSYIKNHLRKRLGIAPNKEVITESITHTFLNYDENNNPFWDKKVETTTKTRSKSEIQEKKMQKLRSEKIEEYHTYREELPLASKALSQKEFLIDKHKQKVRDLTKRLSTKTQKGVL